MRYYHQFQIQNFLANLSPIDFQFSHLFSYLFRTGTRFTSMRLSFPYHLSSVGNWSSLWSYNTTISNTFFFLQFLHSSTKQIVSFHAHYIFKTMNTNSPSHFHPFKGTKKKEISLFMYASFQHTKFSKCNSNIS
jgi:hypothetical protein